MITFTQIPVCFQNRAVARWQNSESFGYLYEDGSCSCWSGKNGQDCPHVAEWGIIAADAETLLEREYGDISRQIYDQMANDIEETQLDASFYTQEI